MLMQNAACEHELDARFTHAVEIRLALVALCYDCLPSLAFIAFGALSDISHFP